MNLELTSQCPFSCPQCYVPKVSGVRELSLVQALQWIGEAARLGIHYVNMSGGETLCYPHLPQLIRACADEGMEVSVSLSGALASPERLQPLVKSKVTGIFVSLNGSTEKINRFTREGYREAIRTLDALQDRGNAHLGVNFVLHGSNVHDLPAMLRLCEEKGVEVLVILQTKPDAAGSLWDVPDAAQLRSAAATIRRYQGRVAVIVDHCYYELRKYLPEAGQYDAAGAGCGCGAGQTQICINADGLLTPCRHLDIPETWKSIEDYLSCSPVLREIREHVAEQPSWRPCMDPPVLDSARSQPDICREEGSHA